jgi:hypothetical protein
VKNDKNLLRMWAVCEKEIHLLKLEVGVFEETEPVGDEAESLIEVVRETVLQVMAARAAFEAANRLRTRAAKARAAEDTQRALANQPA